jgi:hypothetical protein
MEAHYPLRHRFTWGSRLAELSRSDKMSDLKILRLIFLIIIYGCDLFSAYNFLNHSKYTVILNNIQIFAVLFDIPPASRHEVPNMN